MAKDKFDVLDFIMRKEPLTEEEKAFIRKKFPRSKTRVRYGIWKQEQRNKLQIVILTEFNRRQLARRPGVDNSIEFICEYPMCEKEYEEAVGNFGMNSRVYSMFKYYTVQDVMIEEEREYGIKTPQEFVNECTKRGLTRAPDLFTELEKEND